MLRSFNAIIVHSVLRPMEKWSYENEDKIARARIKEKQYIQSNMALSYKDFG